MDRLNVTEKTVEQQLVRMVRHRGGLCLKWVSPGQSGVPDRILLFPGSRILFAEVKRPGGRIAPRQMLWAELLRSFGFEHRFIGSPEDVRRLEALLFEGGDPE